MVQVNLLQSKNRDTDIENKCMDTKCGEVEWVNWEIGIDMYTLFLFFSNEVVPDSLQSYGL